MSTHKHTHTPAYMASSTSSAGPATGDRPSGSKPSSLGVPPNCARVCIVCTWLWYDVRGVCAHARTVRVLHIVAGAYMVRVLRIHTVAWLFGQQRCWQHQKARLHFQVGWKDLSPTIISSPSRVCGLVAPSTPGQVSPLSSPKTPLLLPTPHAPPQYPSPAAPWRGRSRPAPGRAQASAQPPLPAPGSQTPAAPKCLPCE